jgi:hypothetical protein
VPPTAATVIWTPNERSAAVNETHSTEVPVDHDVDLHVYAEEEVVAVKSEVANARPRTVIEVPPVMAAFSLTYDIAGASKVKYCEDVPATAPSVSRSGMS